MLVCVSSDEYVLLQKEEVIKCQTLNSNGRKNVIRIIIRIFQNVTEMYTYIYIYKFFFYYYYYINTYLSLYYYIIFSYLFLDCYPKVFNILLNFYYYNKIMQMYLM